MPRNVLQVVLPDDEQYQMIRKSAAARGISASAYAKQLLGDALAQPKTTPVFETVEELLEYLVESGVVEDFNAAFQVLKVYKTAAQKGLT